MDNAKKRKIALIVSGALTVLICAVMNLWLIPAIESTTEGLRCFDMNSFGYAPETARRFLSLLGAQGRNTYLHAQLPLDFFYPVAYTAFFVLAIRALRGRNSAWYALPAALAVCDYTENVCSIVFLRAMGGSDGLFRFASCVTVVKSALMTATFVLLAVLLLLWLVRRKKAER